MHSFPIRFGNYELFDLLATGGMAEVFRARVAGQNPGGPNTKVIAVKRILPNFSNNKEFIHLFEKEIGLAMSLVHPNLVKIYDFGAIKNQYYIAMEYVHGKSLAGLVEQCTSANKQVPVDFACHVVREVSQALAYAHGLKDKVSGKFVGIVHRDISPQNVLLSYSGEVKLFDFGVAKVVAKDQSTCGSFKGKPAYMSPEQAVGEELDGRTDIFALGIVLWELLTGRNLFLSEQPLLTIKNVTEKPIPAPSTLNPQVPAALDAIVLKCLQRDLNARYQAAQQLAADLDKFLQSVHPGFDEKATADYLRFVFGATIDREQELLMTRMVMPSTGPATNAASIMASAIELDDPNAMQPEWRRSYAEKVFNPSKPAAKAPPSQEEEAPPPPKSSSGALMAVASLAAIGFGAWYWLTQQPATSKPEPVAALAMPAPLSAPNPAPTRQIANAPAPSSNTAFQLAEPAPPPSCASGSTPVCAFSAGAPATFENPCAATAAKAVPLYDGKCDPRRDPVLRFKSVTVSENWRSTKRSNRAATYGQTLEVILEGTNLPPTLRLKMALVSKKTGRDVYVKDMVTISTILTLSEELPLGEYDLELRATDPQGNVLLTKRLDQSFEVAVPADFLTRQIVL